jgi:hopanoid biosynthesis associated RND transporter like protein HpnN
MKRLTDDSSAAKVLAWVARLVFRQRKLIIWAEAVLFVVCVFYTFRHLQFDMSRDNLVGSNKKYQKNYLAFEKEFPGQSDLVVVVESESEEKNRQFVERLGAKLEGDTNFSDVFYKGDLKMMGRKALLFVPEDDLRDLAKKLHDFKPFIGPFTHTTNLVSLFDMMNTEFRTAKPEQNAETESLINALPAVQRIVNQATESLERPGTPPSPGVTALFDAGNEAEQQEYITFAKGKIFLVTCKPRTAPTLATKLKTEAAQDEANQQSVQRLRQLVAETRLEVPGMNVGVTGEPVLDFDEMQQSQRDTTTASIVSLVICAMIFIYGYNETGRPIKATICLVVGLAYTFAFATLVIGHLNILTITFLPMLIGLAIDFGVHLITRYEEELRHGKSEEAAMMKAMVFTGQGIFTGAFTTAGAFLAMGFTNFKGIQEMGIISGGGLLICLIPMMTLLPVLLMRGRQNAIDQLVGEEPKARARLENLWLDRPILVVCITAVLCGLAATQLRKVYFDYNLLHMQSAGLPAVKFEEKLINSAGKSVLFAAVIATNLDEAVRLEQQITNLPSVAKKDGVVSMADYLSGNQTGKLQLIGEIKQELSTIHFAEPDLQPVDIPELSRTLYSFAGYLGMALDSIGTNEPALAAQLESLRNSVQSLRKQMLSGSDAAVDEHARKLAEFQQALFDDMRETFTALRNQDNSAPLRPEDLPKSLHDRFIGVTGKYLLQVYPEKDVWQRENQKEFIEQLRTIDPNVTGTPVQLLEYTELLKKSYEQAALYSLGAIVILVMFHFRSLTSVVIALTPVAIGSIWLGGIMGFFGIPLNPANIMTLPLVLGIGVTNGIHILNRFAEEQHASILARSTGKAVFVSGLTAIAGFGSLVLAKHQGIRSLGYVMATGVTTCMIAGLTFLPALLNWTLRFRPQKKQPSADNAQSTLGREEPR